MLVKIKDSTEGYFTANEIRVEKIKGNKHSEFLNKKTKQMFAVDDINKLKQLLEDEIFYEKIQDWMLSKFYKKLQLGELTEEDFVNVYNKMGHHGFVGVCKRLRAL